LVTDLVTKNKENEEERAKLLKRSGVFIVPSSNLFSKQMMSRTPRGLLGFLAAAFKSKFRKILKNPLKNIYESKTYRPQKSSEKGNP